MYCGVPMIVPGERRAGRRRQRPDAGWRSVAADASASSRLRVAPSTFASPQSMTSTSPKSPSMMFSGFRSRWITPLLCAKATASQTFWKMVSSAGSGYFCTVAVGALGACSSSTFFKRDAAHELHRVERLTVLIHAQLVDGDDVRVLELAGDLRLVDEAREVVGRRAVEHHLHRHAALRWRLRCASRIAPMPPCATTPPMSYFFSRSNSSGSSRCTAAALGASETSGGGMRLHAGAARWSPRRSGFSGSAKAACDSVTGWPLTKVPLLLPRSSMSDVIVIDRELRVPPRDQLDLDLHLAPGSRPMT